MAQINDIHVEPLSLDQERLVSDDAYNLNVAAKLLAKAISSNPNDPKAWSRYHSVTPKFRARWEKPVARYLALAHTKTPTECPTLASL